MNSHNPTRTGFTLLLITAVFCVHSVRAGRSDWKREQVDWRISGGSRIKAVYYPASKPLPLLTERYARRPRALRKETLPAESASWLIRFTPESTIPISTIVIDSPPIDGFVPWIIVAVTDAREAELEINAIPWSFVVGDYTANNPQADYAIGIFDTGAGAHVMGHAAATRARIFEEDLITTNVVTLTGVSGSVDAWVSQPLGVFINGLGAIDANGLLDDSGMVGESNVSIAVGQGQVGLPDLPTAIGTPLSVYFTAVFYNDQPITVIRDNNEFTAPDIRFYDSYDPCIPNYSNVINLQLRPTGAVAVQYFPDILDPYDPDFGQPLYPSMITAFFPTQSLFFLPSVDLYEDENMALDKSGFMFDTGAQVTVVGSIIAARLGLNPNNPDFEVEVMGVTGDTIIVPGFYIDRLVIPALGEWLRFDNVPVVMLDVASPEGGTLEGIIGMNLFVEFNLVLRGGGLPDMGGHSLEFEPIGYHIVADIAPPGGDGVVDLLDLEAFAKAWLADPMLPNWNSKADMVGDAIINFRDFAVFASYWLESLTP